jgi:hypothetical protein
MFSSRRIMSTQNKVQEPIQGVATASDYYGAYVPDNVFDGNPSTAWYVFHNYIVGNFGAPIADWIQYDFGRDKTISYYSIKAGDASYCPSSWKLFGSNNNINFTQLDSRSIPVGTTNVNSYSITPVTFKIFRVLFDGAPYYAGPYISEITFT